MSAITPEPSPPGTTNQKLPTENRKLYLGPAGWDYADWQGVVYPPGLKGSDRLTYLSTCFDAVEINVTFYRPIAPDYARRWLAAVAAAPDFRFTAKVWQVFTHERRLDEADLTQFSEGLAPLLAAGRLGVLLAQFPYSFHNIEAHRAYLLRLKSALPEFPLAVEVRHRSWQQRAVREFLKAAGLDFCNIDQPLVSFPLGATRWVTGTRAYLRCHGRHKEAWFEFGDDRQARYDYLYPPEELEDLAARARELMDKARETYVIFNNHPAGQAVANALELAHLLQPERRVTAPPGLVAAFPRLAALQHE
ncbi:MAG: DUF72 domain-containing protein [Syntrophobacterales bacterium]|jgi:uncharacterized protein YecE (DUF72 family)|nr:DUF72 domain-containing protein [Syntrophobacterales bacterium]